MNEFFGGQTVTFGNLSSDMGRVSTLVEMGDSSQLWKDWWIKNPAVINPESIVGNRYQDFSKLKGWLLTNH